MVVYTRRSRTGGSESAERTAELMQRVVRIYERELAAPYPFPKCDIVFAPEFPALGFSPPGLIIFTDSAFDELANLPARMPKRWSHTR